MNRFCLRHGQGLKVLLAGGGGNPGLFLGAGYTDW